LLWIDACNPNEKEIQSHEVKVDVLRALSFTAVSNEQSSSSITSSYGHSISIFITQKNHTDAQNSRANSHPTLKTQSTSLKCSQTRLIHTHQ
jgi:hypothetical protein